MLPMDFPEDRHWRCFTCNRAVEVVLPAGDSSVESDGGDGVD